MYQAIFCELLQYLVIGFVICRLCIREHNTSDGKSHSWLSLDGMPILAVIFVMILIGAGIMLGFPHFLNTIRDNLQCPTIFNCS